MKKRVLIIALFIMICPALSHAGAVNLPKTGQTTCYDASGNVIDCTGTGQDGDIQAGISWPSPRFEDNGDGTVTDHLTGLVWLKNANCAGQMTWKNAVAYCNNLSSGMCSLSDGSVAGDWHLPNIVELESLVNSEESNSDIWLNNQGITDVQSSYYWSSTTRAGNASYVWLVNMNLGHAYSFYKTSNYCVWPVRAGQTGHAQTWQTGQKTSYLPGDDGDLQQGIAWPSPRFEDNGDGTVTDHLTRLVWLKNANCAGQMSWSQALSFCNSLSSGSYGLTGGSLPGDWRLPNRKELFSLIDYSRHNPALPQGHPFNNAQSSNYYWSATTYSSVSYAAWVLGKNFGILNAHNKVYVNYVWPVRGGETGPNHSQKKPMPFIPLLLLQDEHAIDLDLNSVLVDQQFFNNRQKKYRLEIPENTQVGILSGGSLDLKAELRDQDNMIIDQNSGYNDVGQTNCPTACQTTNDTSGHQQVNFMIRGTFAPGTYYLLVEPQDQNTPTNDSLSIVCLKQPTNPDEFFEGMRALLDDEDESNDFLDIYVRALYPSFYPSVTDINPGTNYDGNTFCCGAVARERQCKALPNFFVNHIFGHGRYLYSDCEIYDHFASNDPDWVLGGDGTTIFNEMSAPVFGDRDDAQQGDIWVMDKGLECVDGKWDKGYNHYGLFISGSEIIDANWSGDGRLQIANDRGSSKIVKPE